MIRFRAMLPLALILIVYALCLWPELQISRVDLNDNVLHLTLIRGMVHAVESGHNPLDFWTPEIALGAPIIRLYQPLSHALVALSYFACLKSVSLVTLFAWWRFLSVLLLPLTFYWTCRLLRLGAYEGIAAAMLCPLVSGDAFGIDAGSYVWAGHGLFPQAVASHFLLLAIGTGWRAIREGENAILPGVLLALCGWSNLMYGYVAAVTILLVTAHSVPGSRTKGTWRWKAKHVWQFNLKPLVTIAGIGLFSALPKLWVWIADSKYMATAGEFGSRQYMTDSIGAVAVLKNLATGAVLDQGRLPCLTILVLAGIALVCWREKRPACKFVLAGFVIWVAIYFGRPFWGNALWMVGITRAMPLHRLIGPVQIFAVLLASVALAKLWERVPTALPRVMLTLLILALPIQERRTYLEDNANWGMANLRAYESERADLEKALALAKQRGGRVFAGMPNSWGAQFRVGQTPVYSFFPTCGIPAIGYMYIGFLPGNSTMYQFDWTNAEAYRQYNVRTVITPDGAAVPAFLRPLERFGRFALYDSPGPGYFTLPNAAHIEYVHGGVFHFGFATGEQHSPGILHLSIPYHPKWHVYLDGRPSRSFMLSDGFTGIPISKNDHSVDVVYQ